MLSWHCQCFPNTRKCFPKNYSLPHIQAPQETLLRFKLNKLGQVYARHIEYKYQQCCSVNVNFIDAALKPAFFSIFLF